MEHLTAAAPPVSGGVHRVTGDVHAYVAFLHTNMRIAWNIRAVKREIGTGLLGPRVNSSWCSVDRGPEARRRLEVRCPERCSPQLPGSALARHPLPGRRRGRPIRRKPPAVENAPHPHLMHLAVCRVALPPVRRRSARAG
jgi:hypothetical protein